VARVALDQRDDRIALPDREMNRLAGRLIDRLDEAFCTPR
jgi:hypothetical protein